MPIFGGWHAGVVQSLAAALLVAGTDHELAGHHSLEGWNRPDHPTGRREKKGNNSTTLFCKQPASSLLGILLH